MERTPAAEIIVAQTYGRLCVVMIPPYFTCCLGYTSLRYIRALAVGELSTVGLSDRGSALHVRRQTRARTVQPAGPESLQRQPLDIERVGGQHAVFCLSFAVCAVCCPCGATGTPAPAVPPRCESPNQWADDGGCLYCVVLGAPCGWCRRLWYPRIRQFATHSTYGIFRRRKNPALSHSHRTSIAFAAHWVSPAHRGQRADGKPGASLL